MLQLLVDSAMTCEYIFHNEVDEIFVANASHRDVKRSDVHTFSLFSDEARFLWRICSQDDLFEPATS